MKILKKYLKKSKLTIRGLAKISGVSPTTICRVLRGERKLSVGTAAKLSSATGLDKIALLFPDEH